MIDHPGYIGVYGASGFGSEVLPLVRQQYAATEIVYVDDNKLDTVSSTSVYSYDDFLDLGDHLGVVIAISNSKVRAHLLDRCIADGVQCMPVRGASSCVYDNVLLGQGSIICDFVTLTSNIAIGVGFHANIYSYVAHDCVVGDFVTFAPGVKCNGNVRIEDHAYIGTGAIIKQGEPGRPIVIGEGAIVGMGAVVTRSVPCGATVVGNPAKELKK